MPEILLADLECTAGQGMPCRPGSISSVPDDHSAVRLAESQIFTLPDDQAGNEAPYKGHARSP